MPSVFADVIMIAAVTEMRILLMGLSCCMVGIEPHASIKFRCVCVLKWASCQLASRHALALQAGSGKLKYKAVMNGLQLTCSAGLLFAVKLG